MGKRGYAEPFKDSEFIFQWDPLPKTRSVFRKITDVTYQGKRKKNELVKC
jgi:hypothetical protein